jgi:hypothetical protein
MNEPGRECVHQWRWLDAVQVTLDRDGTRRDYRNCECTICGLRAWKHGTMPNTPPVIQFASPTTGRS